MRITTRQYLLSNLSLYKPSCFCFLVLHHTLITGLVVTFHPTDGAVSALGKCVSSGLLSSWECNYMYHILSVIKLFCYCPTDRPVLKKINISKPKLQLNIKQFPTWKCLFNGPFSSLEVNYIYHMQSFTYLESSEVFFNGSFSSLEGKYISQTVAFLLTPEVSSQWSIFFTRRKLHISHAIFYLPKNFWSVFYGSFYSLEGKYIYNINYILPVHSWSVFSMVHFSTRKNTYITCKLFPTCSLLKCLLNDPFSS